MTAAIELERLKTKLPDITKLELTNFYKLIYQEAYKEGQKDAQITCGCKEED